METRNRRNFLEQMITASVGIAGLACSEIETRNPEYNLLQVDFRKSLKTGDFDEYDREKYGIRPYDEMYPGQIQGILDRMVEDHMKEFGKDRADIRKKLKSNDFDEFDKRRYGIKKPFRKMSEKEIYDITNEIIAYSLSSLSW